MNDLMDDHIELVFPELPCRIGVLPGENERIQPVRIELAVELSLDPAARTGNLEDTLDYGTLHARARERVLAETWTLLEGLGGALLDLALEDRRVRAASVMVEKSVPPFDTAVGPVRVHMRRRREETV